MIQIEILIKSGKKGKIQIAVTPWSAVLEESTDLEAEFASKIAERISDLVKDVEANINITTIDIKQ